MFINEENSNAQSEGDSNFFLFQFLSFDDDHSPTVVKGKNYASFADWLPVDDSQLFCCTTLIECSFESPGSLKNWTFRGVNVCIGYA
ncbi:Actin-like protein [Trichinella spiralis]|uniref:Actin-like protein n=1 Tax=Trichinella spiralis TaxID=6334 RepID=A0ABR3KV64_TRISP